MSHIFPSAYRLQTSARFGSSHHHQNCFQQYIMPQFQLGIGMHHDGIHLFCTKNHFCSTLICLKSSYSFCRAEVTTLSKSAIVYGSAWLKSTMYPMSSKLPMVILESGVNPVRLPVMSSSRRHSSSQWPSLVPFSLPSATGSGPMQPIAFRQAWIKEDGDQASDTIQEALTCTKEKKSIRTSSSSITLVQPWQEWQHGTTTRLLETKDLLVSYLLSQMRHLSTFALSTIVQPGRLRKNENQEKDM